MEPRSAPADPDGSGEEASQGTERRTVSHPKNGGDTAEEGTEPRASLTDPDGTAVEAGEGAERVPCDCRRQGREKKRRQPNKVGRIW